MSWTENRSDTRYGSHDGVFRILPGRRLGLEKRSPWNANVGLSRAFAEGQGYG